MAGTAHQLLDEWDRLTLEDRYPNPTRILVALRLATDLHTCRRLLQGDPVDPDRLDSGELRRARDRKLVRLDFTELDHLTAP